MVLPISEKLNFVTVPKLRNLGFKLIKEHSEPVFDFKDSTALDSSGLALLLAWLRFAKAEGKTLRFINLPQQLEDMAKLSGLWDIIAADNA